MPAIFVFCVCDSRARAMQTKHTELKPIHRQGGSYHYDFKKVDGGPYALQITLQSLNDDEINHHYKMFKTISQVGRYLTFIPLIYLLSLPKNNGSTYINPTDFWIIIGGTIAAQFALEFIAKNQLDKSIDRYNMLIIHSSTHSLGLSLTYKF